MSLPERFCRLMFIPVRSGKKRLENSVMANSPEGRREGWKATCQIVPSLSCFLRPAIVYIYMHFWGMILESVIQWSSHCWFESSTTSPLACVPNKPHIRVSSVDSPQFLAGIEGSSQGRQLGCQLNHTLKNHSPKMHIYKNYFRAEKTR